MLFIRYSLISLFLFSCSTTSTSDYKDPFLTDSYKISAETVGNSLHIRAEITLENNPNYL